jgi:cyclopropane fatty-acyl-phospholipid synthase-like methyltransferase
MTPANSPLCEDPANLPGAGKSPEAANARQYYDYNTPRFLSYGAQRRARTIHRAVWQEDTAGAEAALHTVHALLAGELARIATGQEGARLRVLDLGSGVGASLFYLAENSPGAFWGAGVTVSPVQAQLSREEASTHDLANRCVFVEADFTDLPFISQFEAAFAIESFAHTPDPARFFTAAAAVLRTGGLLVLCDDVLSAKGEAAKEAGQAELLEIFQWGWGVPSVLPRARLLDEAARAGFTLRAERDLSSGLRLRSLPAWMVRGWAAGLRRLPAPGLYWRSVVGGQALQHAYRRGWLEYRYLVFEKS